MADARALHSSGLDPNVFPASPAVSLSPEIYPNTPPAPSTDPQNFPHLSLTYRADAELKSILQALPTKADIEALVGHVETANRKELRAVKQKV